MNTFKPSDMKVEIKVKHAKLLFLWVKIIRKTGIDLKWLFNFCVKVG
ncbi:hypothetical protein QS460_00680 [Liquorilactobacillus mali]|nr:hypothetical protein [Liquorilactobacillus mali]MDN7144432.1 hypothetical protein [Liquorilactobacillus mali]